MSQRHPRSFMRACLSPQERTDIQGMRSPSVADVPALARLLLAAYRGTIDEEEETQAQALAEIENTFNGEHGPFDPESSTIIATDAEVLSAALVTRWQGRPFVAFSITAPDHQRHGLARACLIGTMEKLRRRGEAELRLVVTLANRPARSLYESLGFELTE